MQPVDEPLNPTSTPTSPEQALVERVWETRPAKCAGCGNERDKLRVCLIVPVAKGGLYEDSNATILCALCLRVHVPSAPVSDRQGVDNMRFVNVWVSDRLGQRLLRHRERGDFASVSSLIGAVTRRFVELPSAFDDLAMYQDVPGMDSKLNARVDRSTYEAFQRMVDARGLSVTDAIKALLLIYLRDESDHHG